ncbi:MAG: hypothetical protein OXT69_14300 [Candidatus Poribacteria bacterium]|nr:hypothetical protein [Candidatus Poribacteria bacterium]
MRSFLFFRHHDVGRVGRAFFWLTARTAAVLFAVTLFVTQSNAAELSIERGRTLEITLQLVNIGDTRLERVRVDLDPVSTARGVKMVSRPDIVEIAAKTGNRPCPFAEIPVTLTADQYARVNNPFLLRFVVSSGTTRWYVNTPAVIVPRATPNVPRLSPNFPNPFNPETWIPFQLTEGTHALIDIYDMRGRLIRRLDLGYREAGYYHTTGEAAYWDGRNGFGEPVSSGTYFYRFRAGSFSSTGRMTIIK